MLCDWAKLSHVRVDYKPIVLESGDTARAQVSLLPRNTSAALNVHLKMKRVKTHWQVVEIEDCADLVKQVDALKTIASRGMDKPERGGKTSVPQEQRTPSISGDDSDLQKAVRAHQDQPLKRNTAESAANTGYSLCSKILETSTTVHFNACFVGQLEREDARLNKAWKLLTSALDSEGLKEERAEVDEPRAAMDKAKG